MQYRKLGRTGRDVSEIGFGAWGIGKAMWVGAEDEESIAALKEARAAGVNFFDTALAYGDGHSEQLIGRAFGKSREVVIASKVPPKNMIWPAPPGSRLRDVFPKDYVLACLDRTLKNLARDQVDVYQFHVWNDDWAGDPEWQATAREMRSSGKTAAVGISINDHQPSNAIKALETGLVDTVQVIYNIFDESPEDELFPYCQKNNIGVIVRVPFDEGSLTGRITPDTTFPEADWRNKYFAGKRKQEVWDRVQAMVRDLGITIEELPTIALRFCLSHPAVSTVIPGMRSSKHVLANTAASDLGPLPPEVLEKIRKYRWVRNYYE